MASVSQDNTSNKSNNKNTEITFDNVPWPVRPSVGINYNFVVLMYTVGSIIAVFFYLLEKQVLDPLLVEHSSDNNNTLQSNDIKDSEIEGDEGGEDANPWKEFARGMAGMYVIFVPFIPCLIWSFVVRYYWLKETNNNTTREKKDN